MQTSSLLLIPSNAVAMATYSMLPRPPSSVMNTSFKMSKKRSYDQFSSGLPIAPAFSSIQQQIVPPQSFWSRISNVVKTAVTYVYEVIIADSLSYEDYIAERERKRRRLQPPGAWIETPGSRRRSPKHSASHSTPSRRLNFYFGTSPRKDSSKSSKTAIPLEESPDICTPSETAITGSHQKLPLTSSLPKDNLSTSRRIRATEQSSPNYIECNHEAYSTAQAAKNDRAGNKQTYNSPDATLPFISPDKSVIGQTKEYLASPTDYKQPKASLDAVAHSSPLYANDMGFLPDATPEKPRKMVHWHKDSVIHGRPQNNLVKIFHHRKAINEEASPQWTTHRNDTNPDTPDSVGSDRLVKADPADGLPSPQLIAASEPLRVEGTRKHLYDFTISKSKWQIRLEDARREVIEQNRAAYEAKKAREEEQRLYQEEQLRLRIQRQKERQAQKVRDSKIIVDVGPAWESKLGKILEIKNPATITAPGSKNSGEISRRSMETLLPSNGALHGGPSGWLNDEIVNAYLESAVDHVLKKSGFSAESGQTRKYHAFNTNMYNTYKTKGADGVKRWFNRPRIAGKDLFKVEKVFVPINEASHWTLLVISGTNKTISYYDSLGGKGEKFTKFAFDIVKATLGEDFKEKEWKIAGGVLSGRQTNGKDCGVFTCLNALSLLAGKLPTLAVQSESIPMGRKMMAATLVDGGFGKDFDF